MTRRKVALAAQPILADSIGDSVPNALGFNALWPECRADCLPFREAWSSSRKHLKAPFSLAGFQPSPIGRILGVPRGDSWSVGGTRLLKGSTSTLATRGRLSRHQRARSIQSHATLETVQPTALPTAGRNHLFVSFYRQIAIWTGSPVRLDRQPCNCMGTPATIRLQESRMPRNPLVRWGEWLALTCRPLSYSTAFAGHFRLRIFQPRGGPLN